MGLRSIFQAAAKVAFNVAGDVKTSVTVYASPTYTHDATLDESTPTWGATITANGILYDHTDKKENDKPETITKALLLQVADLQGADITQEAEVQADGVRWKTRKVTPDPAGATVELILYR